MARALYWTYFESSIASPNEFDVIDIRNYTEPPNICAKREEMMDDTKFCPRCGRALVDKEFDGKIRRACEVEMCSYVFWNNPVPVVTAVIEYNGKILLARNKLWPENIFGLITGFLESNETPEHAIAREVKEELGLDSKITDFLGLYTFPPMNQLLIAYAISASGTIALSDELAEFKLVPIEKVRPWDFGTELVLREWIRRRGKYLSSVVTLRSK